MNNLDNAVKSLEGALRDVTSQERALARERKRLEAAIRTLAPKNGRPVGDITGVKIQRGKVRYPDGEKMAARRAIMDGYVGALQPGTPFTVDDFLTVTGESPALLNRKMWMAHLNRMSYKGKIAVQSRGGGPLGPSVYLVK